MCEYLLTLKLACETAHEKQSHLPSIGDLSHLQTLNFRVLNIVEFLFAMYVILPITTSFFRELKSSISDLKDQKIKTYIRIYIRTYTIHTVHIYVYKYSGPSLIRTSLIRQLGLS